MRSIREDIASVFDHDPAAKSVLEVCCATRGCTRCGFIGSITGSGTMALRLLARWLSQVARLLRGSRFIRRRKSDGACSSITAWASSSGKPA